MITRAAMDRDEILKTVPNENKGGNCYKKAFDYFMSHRSNSIVLCHGVVTGQGAIDGIKYNHAWVEELNSQKVIDNTMPPKYREMDRYLYYLLGRVSEDLVYQYSIEDVQAKIEEFGTYGPWEKDLLIYP